MTGSWYDEGQRWHDWRLDMYSALSLCMPLCCLSCPVSRLSTQHTLHQHGEIPFHQTAKWSWKLWLRSLLLKLQEGSCLRYLMTTGNNHVILGSEMSKSVAAGAGVLVESQCWCQGPDSPMLGECCLERDSSLGQYRAHMGRCSVQGPPTNKEGFRHKLLQFLNH